MRKVGLVLKSGHAQALALAEEISRILVKAGKDILIEEPLLDFSSNWGARPTSAIADEADLIVALGGDGTILRVAALLNDKPVPVLGVNLGRVGFLAEISPEEVCSEVQSAIEGDSILDKRMMLEVALPDNSKVRVLNEVVIHWSGVARMIDILVRLEATRDIEIRADGVIVATPLGSSAYSYAAGGPLVHPDTEAMLITPICPYFGLTRPLALPSNRTVELIIQRGETFKVTIDGGASRDLKLGDTIKIRKSSIPFIIVKSRSRGYFDALDAKLGLVR
ncbi:MAG: NAD(+)/NADH kinase [Desulfomonilaceae bacterium]